MILFDKENTNTASSQSSFYYKRTLLSETQPSWLNKKKLQESKEWKDLELHFKQMQHQHMRKMFSIDSQRFRKFSCQHGELLLDYSKNRINEETMKLLIRLARKAGIESWRDKMFRGDAINNTEKRAVLHTALRNRKNTPVLVDGKNIMPEINNELSRIRHFSNQVRTGKKCGYKGGKITDVVNIGIGGSDLGPKLVCQALKNYSKESIRSHFVSNVDSSDLLNTLKKIKPEHTLFVISSKSFSTSETMLNANSIRNWFIKKTGNVSAIKQHFVAISTNHTAAKSFGISDKNIFSFWDWVGGRYSLWSAIGLPIALSHGMECFEELLEGAHDMDQHFCSAPLHKNIPTIMAMIGIWYNNFFNWHSQAIIPYCQQLQQLPAYLQQLDMESNGKISTRDGTTVNYATSPVIWGEAGTNGQHAFFQLLHQGSQLFATDFIVCADDPNSLPEHHQTLFANCLAQSKALMKGKQYNEAVEEMLSERMKTIDIISLAPHKVFEGNRPSNTIMLDQMTPKSLGSLLASYEHKTFVQGIIWDINSFDQWGVEYGKILASKIKNNLSLNEKAVEHDASTNGLINYRQKLRS